MSNKETKVFWDDIALVPFAIINNDAAKNTPKNPSSNIWISYEDARSARKKAEYVKQMSLGGVAIWSLDMDDFKGLFCNLGPFPIIESIKQELDRSILDISVDENTEYSSVTSVKQQSTFTTKLIGTNKEENPNTPKRENDGTALVVTKHTTTKPASKTTIKTSTKNDFFETNKDKKFNAIRKIRVIGYLKKNKQTNSSSKLKNPFKVIYENLKWLMIIIMSIIQYF